MVLVGADCGYKLKIIATWCFRHRKREMITVDKLKRSLLIVNLCVVMGFLAMMRIASLLLNYTGEISDEITRAFAGIIVITLIAGLFVLLIVYYLTGDSK